MGVPNGDPYETNFISGERNIFRQSWQRRADASLVKDLLIHDQFTLHYTFDVYNLTNTTSFDIPQNNVNQNAAFNNVPVGRPPRSSLPIGSNPGLGITRHSIGSARQIQMSLHLDF